MKTIPELLPENFTSNQWGLMREAASYGLEGRSLFYPANTTACNLKACPNFPSVSMDVVKFMRTWIGGVNA